MMSNIVAITSTSSPPVNTDWRYKTAPSEDAARQVRTDDPSQSTDASQRVDPPDTTRATALATEDRDAQSQETKSKEAKTLGDAVDELNQRFQGLPQISLQFKIDQKAEQVVVKVMDVENDEMIRQIPPEEVLELVAFLKEKQDKEAGQMAWAALAERGLTPPKASAQGGLLLRTTA